MYLSLTEIIVAGIIILYAGFRLGGSLYRKHAAIPMALKLVGHREALRYLLNVAIEANEASQRIINALALPPEKQNSKQMAEDFLTHTSFKLVAKQSIFDAEYFRRDWYESCEMTDVLLENNRIDEEVVKEMSAISEKARTIDAGTLRTIKIEARREWLKVNLPKMKHPGRRYDLSED